MDCVIETLNGEYRLIENLNKTPIPKDSRLVLVVPNPYRVFWVTYVKDIDLVVDLFEGSPLQDMVIEDAPQNREETYGSVVFYMNSAPSSKRNVLIPYLAEKFTPVSLWVAGIYTNTNFIFDESIPEKVWQNIKKKLDDLAAFLSGPV
ncbi:MAG: hypothetical protein N3A54_00815 [Patescibacteria group bacterium]|nr:hypothetical protein [Patescibacteria group bacterium]